MSAPRVIELIRVSSDGQHDRGTPEVQRRALDRLREQRPGRVLARIDPPGGVSGALPIAQRPDVIELRRHIAAEGMDELRVYALDRITRADSLSDRAAVLTMVADAGAVIVEATGRVIDPREDVGELEYLLRTMWARRERERILDRTRDGKHRAAAEGRIVGQSPGYAWVRHPDGSATLDEERAEVARRIFGWCIEGRSLREISDALAAEGIPTATGRPRWTGRAVRHLIRSTAYRGVFVQKVSNREYETPVPRVVSDGTWYAAQRALASRANPGRRGSVQALARGRLYCGRCGLPCYVRAPRPDKHLSGAYRCRSSRADLGDEPCGAPWHDLTAVDATLWSVIHETIERPDLLGQATEEGEDQMESWQTQIAQCEATLRKAHRDERRVLDLMSRDLLSEEVATERLERLRTARHTAERSKEVAETAIRAHKQQAAVLAGDAVEGLRAQLADADFATRRALVELLIPKAPGFGISISDFGEITVQMGIPLQSEHSPRAMCRLEGEAEPANVLPFRRIARVAG